MLNTTPETVSAMIRNERLPAAKIGRAWVLVDVDVIRWLRGRYAREEKKCGFSEEASPMPGGVIWHQAWRVRKSTGTTDRREAQEYADRLKAELWRYARLGERPAITWDAAVLDWLEAHQHLRTLSDRKDQLRFASKWLKGKPLKAIDRNALDALGKKKAATGVGPATVNRHLAAVSAVLGHAFKKGWLPVKPPIPKRHEPEERIRWATQEQARKLIAALPRHLAAMAEFPPATGLRQSNVTHLEWSQVDLGRRLAWIHADQAKGKRDLAVPLSDAAIAVLQRQLGGTPAGCSRIAVAPSSNRHRLYGSLPARRRSSATPIGTICATRGRVGMCRTALRSRCCRSSVAGAT